MARWFAQLGLAGASLITAVAPYFRAPLGHPLHLAPARVVLGVGP